MSPRTIHHVISEREGLGRRLSARISGCDSAIIATAFLTRAGFHEIESAVESGLDGGAEFSFLIGRFDYVTEPQAIRKLLRLRRRYATQIGVFFDSDYGFHYKVALFRENLKTAILIGSSNLTAKGISSVGEVNIEIINQTGLYHALRVDLESRIRDSESAEEALTEYEKAYKQHKKYRADRARLEAVGHSKWRRKVPPKLRIDFGSVREKLIHCRIDSLEEDREIVADVQRTRARERRHGIELPNQWIHVGAKFAKLIKKDRPFLVTDDVSRTIGLARCIDIASVLDANDRTAKIIFYRYRHGYRLRFRKPDRYQSLRAKMALGDREILRKAAVARVEAVLLKVKRRVRRRRDTGAIP